MALSKGRPPIDNPKNGRIDIRITPQEKAEIKQFAQDHGYTLLELIREGIKAVKKNADSGDTLNK